MASLNGQTIASSYEQLLHVDRDGGGNANTLVSVKDGDNGTTFGIKLATNKVEIIPGSNDTNAFEVSQADGTAVLTVDSTNALVGVGAAPASGTADPLQITTPASGGGQGLSILRTDNNASQLIGRIIAGNSVDAELASITFNTDGANDSGNIIFNTEVTGGSLAEAMRIDSSQNSTFSGNVSIVKSNDGGDVSLTIKNSAGAGSTDETSSIQFTTTSSGHATAAVIGARQSNYNDSASRDGELKLQASENGSLGSKLILRGSEAEFFTNVGIGASQSSYHSDFNNLVVYENGNAGISIIGSTSGESSLGFGDGTGADTYRGAVAYVHTSGDNQDKMFFKTSSLNRMVIDSSGAVGIGSTSPSQKLTISTTSSDDGIELISTNSGSVGPTFESYHNAGQGNAAANDFIFVQRAYGDNDKGSGFEKVEFGNTSFQASDVGDGTEDSKYRIGTIKNGTLATRFIIDGEAVGIGTESPSASRLHVQSPDALNSTAYLVTMQNLETTDGHCQGLFINAGQGSSDDALRIQTRPGVEALRVKGDASTSISYGGSATAFQVNTSANGARAIDLVHSDGSVDNQDEILRCRFSGTGDPTGGRFIAFEDSQARMGMIEAANGTNVAYTVGTSDINTKKNLEEWDEDVLEHFKALKPKRFHYKRQEDSKEKNKGYIAQDLKDAFPEAYPLSTYKEDDGDKQYYGFNPSGMVVYLMKAVQELSLKVQELEKTCKDCC